MTNFSIDISKGQVHPPFFVRLEQSMKITSYRKQSWDAFLLLFVTHTFPHLSWEVVTIIAMLSYP